MALVCGERRIVLDFALSRIHRDSATHGIVFMVESMVL